MRRSSAVAALLACVCITATAVSPGLAQDGDPGLMLLEPELRNGTWFGTGIVDGTAELAVERLELFLELRLYGNFFFDVTPDGSVTGEWDIVEPSAGTMDLQTADAYAGTLDATYGGTGQVTGDRRRVEADGTISQIGVLSGPGIRGDIQSNSTDELPSTIVADVTTAFCNEVYGEWVFSWEQVLRSEGWEPTFSGEWVAVRQSADFEEEIADGQIERMATEFAEAVSSWGDLVVELKARDWSTPLDVAEWDAVTEHFEEFERLQNEIRNLTPCDRDVIGEDKLERWETGLASGMLAVIEGAALGGDLYGSDIADLVSMGLRAGVLGEGSAHSEIRADAAEALRLEANDIVNDHFDFSIDEQGGRGFDAVPGATESDDFLWAVEAGIQMNWTFTLSGGGASAQVPAADLTVGRG